MFSMRSWVLRGMLAAVTLTGAMAGEAHARIFIGVGIPLFVPPIYAAPYYYPPYYYAPPSVYAPPGNTFNYTPPSAQPQSLAPPRTSSGGYAPSGGYTPSTGSAAQSCQAGAYVCPLVEDTPRGGACACPGHNGQQIRGQAN